MVRVVDSFGVMVRVWVRIPIRLYKGLSKTVLFGCKTTENQNNVIIFGRAS